MLRLQYKYVGSLLLWIFFLIIRKQDTISAKCDVVFGLQPGVLKSKVLKKKLKPRRVEKVIKSCKGFLIHRPLSPFGACCAIPDLEEISGDSLNLMLTFCQV